MIARTYGARALLLVRARTAAPTVRGGKTYAFKFSFHLLMKKIVIAIDGHSSCGKSTMAKAWRAVWATFMWTAVRCIVR